VRVAREIDMAAPYLEMGVKHFRIDWGVRILHDRWRVNGGGMRAMLKGGSSAPAPEARAR